MKIIRKQLPLFAFSLLIMAILTNCHSIENTTQMNSFKKNAGEDFVVFYDRFHKDSLFQVSRCQFPMGGMSLDGPIETKWTRFNLPLLRTRIYDVDTSEYKVAYKKTGKAFTQKVWIENSEFISEIRFELIKSKWYLVYVLDQNF